ncbi:MAG: hypothetical protein LBP67_02320 [Bacteroidales bacterium]|nr:hypothetical protein [Bacteroidales bacterium]
MKKLKVLLVFFSLFMVSGMVYGQHKVQTTVEIICPESTEVTITVTSVDSNNHVIVQEKTINLVNASLLLGAHVGSALFSMDSSTRMLYITASTLSGRYGSQSYNQHVGKVTFDFR